MSPDIEDLIGLHTDQRSLINIWMHSHKALKLNEKHDRLVLDTS